MNRKPTRALLSVSDKTGLVPFATALHKTYGVELIATGGTKKILADAGLPVKDVSELTAFPEILDGRVKTLHPALYAGLLAKRDKPGHMSTLAEHKLPEIDLVVCNLYPFEQTIAQDGVTEAEAIENIDIGGPCMIRAAAKNFEAVSVVIEPEQYDMVLEWLSTQQGATTRANRLALAQEAFFHIQMYDQAIATWFHAMDEDEGSEQLEGLTLHFVAKQDLRYGENPHQEATFFVEPYADHACVSNAEQLHGKELSYNNILDLDSALNVVREFSEPAAVVVKHNNPCGAATASSLTAAFTAAWDGDPLAAFGGILAFNRNVDLATATALMTGERFVECVIAPEYDAAALEALKGWKKNVRLMRTGPLDGGPQGHDYRRVDGGLLVQSRDVNPIDASTWKCVTKTAPTKEQLASLAFAWTVGKHVKSNAILLAKGTHIVGVGAGQMSRIDSTQIAIKKAGDKAKGSVLASDAFFPFADNVQAAAAAGIVAIAQPGGSTRDQESIDACNAAGIAMVFTGTRHFRH
ncbi:bifunctional phosphoribosylaminoimidazolecarboxamide formyltransferase/IMP cyclohydrolase [soil metagenome]